MTTKQLLEICTKRFENDGIKFYYNGSPTFTTIDISLIEKYPNPCCHNIIINLKRDLETFDPMLSEILSIQFRVPTNETHPVKNYFQTILKLDKIL